MTSIHSSYFRQWHGKDNFQWVNTETGDVKSAIGYEISTKDPQKPWARLFYNRTYSD